MSRILKKSLAVVLALALCFSCMICSVSADAVYTASYKISFGSVADERLTATLNITSTAEDLAAVLFGLNLPNLPVTAVEPSGVFSLSTAPDYEEGLPTENIDYMRVLMVTKDTGTSYNYANFKITFDVSSKALVAGGYNPDVASAINISVDSMSAASYSGGLDGFEGDVWIQAASDATTDSLGRVSATTTAKGSCTHSGATTTTVTAATCSKEGLDRVSCPDCGYTYDIVTEKAAHTWNAGVETTPAGCVTDGVKTFTCTVCNSTKTEAIASVGSHSFRDISEYEAYPEDFIAAGDCWGTLVLTPVCTVCGTEGEEVDTGEQGPHDVNWYEDVAPTCNSQGYRMGECDSCGEELTEYYGEATGEHSWGEGAVTTAATCGKDGVMTYTCADCSTTKTEAIAATGAHTWDAGVETTPPTTTTEGVKTFTCTVCQATKTESIPVLEEDCKHTNLAAAAFEANTSGTYDAVIRCADCNEVVVTTTTDIPAGTATNSAITPTRMAYVSDNLGVGYILTNSQLSSYTSYGIRVYRKTCDSSYNFISANAGEVTTFTKYGSTRKVGFYTGLALYELNLPVTAVIVGYDASGNIISVSNPLVDYPIDLIWNTYNVSTATDTYKTCCMDIVNLASEAQIYFAPEGSELAESVLPRDKYAFDQSDATQTVPTYDLSTMPNTITPNASSTISTTTYGLVQNVSLASGSPAVSYMVKKGKNLDRSKLKLEVSYTSSTGEISKTVVGDTATETTDAWTLFSSYAYYSFTACKLYDTNKTITAKFIYDGVEMYTSVYSVETFVATNINDAALGNVLQALAKMGPSTRANFNLE